MIDKGFRAQLRSGNLLTGQQYIGVDFFRDTPKFTLDIAKYPLEMPAVPSSLEELEKTVARMIKKMDGILSDTEKLMKRLDTETMPEFNKTLIEAKGVLKNAEVVMASDSPLQTDLRDALRELTRAASSLKKLTDMLDQQPQSLIFGKPPEEIK